MSISKKISYNVKSAKKYGWKVQDFNATDFNEDLIDKIEQFQKENGLVADGMCGSRTYRYLRTVQLEDLELPSNNPNGEEYIICQGHKIPIKWSKVIVWNETGGLKASNYKKVSEIRDTKFFVTHWDATLSAHHCARILGKRKLSVHFLIDNDGTIYQMADTNDICYHAGGANKHSIGVEISNAYYLKWQDWYKRKGFGERPIVKNAVCHGKKMKPFTGFYPVQIEALVALYEAIHKAHNIPLVSPEVKTSVDPKVANFSFRGFCSHYHYTKKKIDCAGLDLDDVCKKAITLSNS
jgi:hypothetical protein